MFISLNHINDFNMKLTFQHVHGIIKILWPRADLYYMVPKCGTLSKNRLKLLKWGDITILETREENWKYVTP